MRTRDAVFSGGVFRPLEEVSVAENQRVRLTIETSSDSAQVTPIQTAQDLLTSDLIGMWADRQEIGDNQEFARQLRAEAERRHGSSHAAG